MKHKTLPPIERIKELLHYDPDTGVFTRQKTAGSRAVKGYVAGRQAGNGYIHVNIDYERWLAHRLAWLYMTETDPGSLEVDHINRDKSDNRFCNLRLVTSSSNKINSSMRSHNKSGYRGVSWSKSRQLWRATIGHNRKQVFLGEFVSPSDAAAAYDRAAAELHGEYAITNEMILEAVK